MMKTAVVGTTRLSNFEHKQGNSSCQPPSLQKSAIDERDRLQECIAQYEAGHTRMLVTRRLQIGKCVLLW